MPRRTLVPAAARPRSQGRCPISRGEHLSGQDRERLKQLRGLAVLPMIEITERGGIFRIHITSIQKSLVLRLARLERQYGKKGDRHKLQICL